MTVIYVKRTGQIKSIFSGDLQNIEKLYGDEAQDYKLIWDEIIIPDDDFVMRNPQSFKVNPESKQLEMLSIINQYPVAAQ